MIDLLTGSQIVGLTIFGEARGEPIEGQVAVGSVIRNRLHDNPSKYKSFKDVCLEKSQFSCWNKNDPNYPKLMDLVDKIVKKQIINDFVTRQCLFVGEGIVGWSLLDNTKSSLNYITKNLFYSDKKPSWAKNVKLIQEIGNHIFFTA